jgi:hypothetical protein
MGKKSGQFRIDALQSKIALYVQAKAHIEGLGKQSEITLNSTLGELVEWINPRLNEMEIELKELTDRRRGAALADNERTN